MIPVAVHLCRDTACAACKTPCALATDAIGRAAHCSACPLTPPAWPQWDCRPSATAPVLLGDRVAAAIETHVLKPAERFAPKVVAVVRKCGGCKADQRGLNGGKLSGEGKGPPVV